MCSDSSWVDIGSPMAKQEQPDMTSVKRLLAFLDASPSPYHAVEQIAARLTGFARLSEGASWDKLQPGDRCYFTRNGSAMVAFAIGHKYVTFRCDSVVTL